MMKSIFLIFLLALSISLVAQISYEKRIEFELNDEYFNEQIFRFKDGNFLMVSQNEDSRDGMVEWKYDLYNSNLEFVKTKSYFIDRKLQSDEYWVGDDRIHALFKNRKGDFSLYTIDIKTLEETKVDGILPKKTFVRDMAIIDDYAYFNAVIKKAEVLFSINWKTGKQNIIPLVVSGYNPKKTYVENFQILESSKEVFASVKAMNGKNSEIYVFRLNNKGEKQDMFKFTDAIDKNIISVSASNIEKDRYVFTGTYGKKFVGKGAMSFRTSDMSNGIYFCEADNQNVKYIEYYNFTEFENFFKYISEKKQEKMEKKVEKKKAKGKELNYNYRIAEHQVIQTDDGYIFLGEAYYPTYRTEYYTTYVNGKPVTQTRRVFDGYQYTHAVLAKFDKSGKKQWDQVFEMWPNQKPFYVKRFISIAENQQNSINLVYTVGNNIISKSFTFDGEIKSEKKYEEIQTSFEGDKTKWTNPNLGYWYDNFFLAFGSQKIKNTDDKNDVKKKRKVFFVSKVKFE